MEHIIINIKKWNIEMEHRSVPWNKEEETSLSVMYIINCQASIINVNINFWNYDAIRQKNSKQFDNFQLFLVLQFSLKCFLNPTFHANKCRSIKQISMVYTNKLTTVRVIEHVWSFSPVLYLNDDESKIPNSDLQKFRICFLQIKLCYFFIFSLKYITFHS